MFGFARIDDDSDVEKYIEHWFMHVYVGAKGAVTGVRFEKSRGIRRHLEAADMSFLGVSCFTPVLRVILLTLL